MGAVEPIDLSDMKFSGGHRAANPADYGRMEWEFQLPFPGFAFQQEAFSNLADLPASALYHEPGLGKTFTSTLIALHKQMFGGSDMTVVVMPPILLVGWYRFLEKVRRRDGSPLKVLLYAGTPAKRKTMKFRGYDFVLVSVDIFKRDLDRFMSELGHAYVHIIVDEATSIKNIDTANHQAVRDFSAGNTLELLTGTPLNRPTDAYAYIKLIAPGTYRNLNQFERLHVAERDFFDRPIKYANLDMLREHFLLNADRRLKEDVLTDLPPVNISAQEYALDPKHLKLYHKLADEQLLLLPDGSKIDGTSASKLFHLMGQIVCNWSKFAPEVEKEAKSFELVQQLLDELNGGKLVVFARYQATNARIIKHFAHANAVGVWGGVTKTQKQVNIDRFVNDPSCRLITLQEAAAGLGIDGLQHVCSNVFYFEPPSTPALLDQTLSRVYRSGQRLSVNVRIGMAEGTCQVRHVNALVNNKELVDYLQGSRTDLRAALFGN